MKRRVLASEHLPAEFSDAICFICGFPAPVAAAQEEKPAQPEARPLLSRVGAFIRNATELWPARKMADGRYVPSWVLGEIEASVQRENPLFPYKPKQQRLSLTYGARGPRWQRYWQDTKGRAR